MTTLAFDSDKSCNIKQQYYGDLYICSVSLISLENRWVEINKVPIKYIPNVYVSPTCLAIGNFTFRLSITDV